MQEGNHRERYMVHIIFYAGPICRLSACLPLIFPSMSYKGKSAGEREEVGRGASMSNGVQI